MISSNEKHINTNSIFILITEVNQHVTGETDEDYRKDALDIF